MILNDKTVIITGVGPGMGRAMAIGAAREGAKVALCARSEAFLSEVLSQITREGGHGIAVRTDVASTTDCERLVKETLDAFGRIDGIVNSAYFHPPWSSLESADLEDLQKAFDVNCLGGLRVIRAALPAMKRQRSGSIVNVGTLATRKPMIGEGGYAMAKSALHQSTRQLAVELGEFGIRVNQALMGWMMGVPLQQYFDSMPDRSAAQAEQQKVASRIPLARIPADADCAKVVYFLLSDYSSEMTGAALEVNGGEWLAP
jgi:NAD(P)-dependent dehydrogenase (short-subunit alcohol dehydrogenase family)